MNFKRSDTPVAFLPINHIGQTFVVLDPTFPEMKRGDVLLVVRHGAYSYAVVDLTSHRIYSVDPKTLQGIVDSPAYYEEVILNEPIAYRSAR